jgi:hypothetical protein
MKLTLTAAGLAGTVHDGLALSRSDDAPGNSVKLTLSPAPLVGASPDTRGTAELATLEADPGEILTALGDERFAQLHAECERLVNRNDVLEAEAREAKARTHDAKTQLDDARAAMSSVFDECRRISAPAHVRALSGVADPSGDAIELAGKIAVTLGPLVPRS